MPVDVTILVVTALVAVVAVVAAVVAVRALREVRRIDAGRTAQPAETSTELVASGAQPIPAVSEPRPVQMVEGRVVATLSQQDLLEARLSRPLARISVYAHGIVHALRPESRDRITALMRREYRRRRAMRLKVARRALRSVPNEVLARPDDWMGSADDAAQDYPRAVGQ